ncbi:MAG: hypothetical protein NC418_09635 [Muribaculaceae bacterium]|nr:hypothetical protein [Muribaculaceae bacterium]
MEKIKPVTAMMKKFVVGLLCGISLGLCSCSDQKAISLEQASAQVDNMLTSLNIQHAKAIYQKGGESRASKDNGFYKLDISGNEVKLQICGADGKIHDIGIDWVVNVKARYVFFQPNTRDLINVVSSAPDYDADSDEAVATAALVTCVADVKTGKLYKFPIVDLSTDKSFTAQEALGKFYIKGFEHSVYGGPFDGDQIFEFNPSDMTIRGILPQGQGVQSFGVNQEGFVYYLESSLVKVKCPGGAIVPIQTDVQKMLTIGGKFYGILGDAIYELVPSGNNGIEKKKAHDLPTAVYIDGIIFNDLQNLYLIKSYDVQNGEKIWSFDGNSLSSTTLDIPMNYQMETKDGWFSCTGMTDVERISKADYSTTTISMSEYQIYEYTSDLGSTSLPFSALRYADGKSVIGQITNTGAVEILAEMNSSSPILNLVPLN